MSEPIIKIQNLNVIYFPGKSNEIHALKNINLEIYPGEFIIFFGPSGCGKSTLLYSIAGLELNTHGDIFIDNKNIATMNKEELEIFHREKIGMIFQAYYLIPSLTVARNVTLPQIFKEVSKNERRQKALELLNKFGVGAQAKKLPNELSGGQQQRVAICRALINNPDILLADEPVGNLDSVSAEEVMGLLSKLNDEQKKTVILVTHNPAHLSLAHRVFYMKDGVIIDTKVNKVIDKSIKKLVETEAIIEKINISKDLELLLRTYSSLSSAQAGNLLLPFKAKQIVLEAMIGTTSDEIEKIQKKVENLIMRGIDDNDEILNYLDIDIEKGGLGFDKRTAEKLVNEIKKIISEIKYLEEAEKKANQGILYAKDQEAVEIRRYLLDIFDKEISSIDSIKILDQTIRERLDNRIDRFEFQKILDLPIEKGGVGFDKRTARKISERLELLILGKYK